MKYKGSLKALCGILLLGIAFFWLSQKEFAAGYPHESLENSLAYLGMIDVAVFDMDFRGTSALDNRVIAGTFGR
jgi:hypothetical protein